MAHPDAKMWNLLLEVRRRPLWAFAFALGLTLFAAVLRLILNDLLQTRVPLVTFYPAVLIAAAVAGLWPGIVAAAVSLGISWAVLSGPAGSNDPQRLIILAVAGALLMASVWLLNALVDYLRDQQRRARKAEQQLHLMVRELEHRTRNIFAVIGAVAASSLKEASTLAEVREKLQGRIEALAYAYSIATEVGSVEKSLNDLLDRQLAAYAGRIDRHSCAVRLNSQGVQQIALVLHELMTNAVKYGALSTATGRIRVRCRIEGDSLVLTWSESGGPAVVPPQRTGFGTMVLRDAAQHLGEAAIEYRPEGVHYVCRLRLKEIASDAAAPESQAAA